MRYFFKIDPFGYNPTLDPDHIITVPTVTPSDSGTSLELKNSDFDIYSVTLPSSPQLHEFGVEIEWEMALHRLGE